MGFDVARFIGEIDGEFQCSICSMVLENPVQSPCDHLFCLECIEKWLSIKKSCPVDRVPLTKTDLNRINRSLRNLLNKLEIKCDFDSQGCNAIVKLECHQGHLASCDYNPDALIVCDRGCNLEMGRRAYQTSNCFAHLAEHLAVSHKKEIAALEQELNNQKEHSAHQCEAIGRLSNEVIQLRREKRKLKIKISKKKLKKLSDEVHQLRRQQNQFEASMQQQKQEIANLKSRMKWALSCNIKSPFDQPDVLETDDKYSWGSVRLLHALKPKNSSFKVQILNGERFLVGLSSKVKTNGQFGESFANYIGEDGTLSINNVIEYEGTKCKTGDIIELGIKFPLNFVNDGNASVELYLSINEQVVKENVIEMPTDAIYPTIIICDSDTKIKYFGI